MDVMEEDIAAISGFRSERLKDVHPRHAGPTCRRCRKIVEATLMEQHQCRKTIVVRMVRSRFSGRRAAQRMNKPKEESHVTAGARR